MPDLPLLLSFLALVGGVLIAYYYRMRRETWGTIAGVAVAIMGAYFALVEYAVFSGVVVVLGGALLIVLFALIFLASGRDPRVLLLMGFPIIILIETYAYYVLTLQLLLLEYAALSVAVVSAYDYSNADITVRVRSVGGLLRVPVWVFSSIHGLVERIIERPSRGVVAVAYFAFSSVVLVIVPFLVAKLSGDAVPPEPLIIVGLAYFYLTKEAIARAPQPNGNSLQ